MSDVLIQAGRLSSERRPFALATVVRVERPASARPGDRAIVTPDGAIEGWVGGACSEPMVIEEALAALGEGDVRLVVVEGGCASEGRVEVLVEPCLPRPEIAVIGDCPAAATLRRLLPEIGWSAVDEVTPDADAVVVATMGRGDAAALETALATEARYVGLVASGRRAGTVMADLRARGLGEREVARVHSPAGLDLGSSTQEEIGVAILAQLIAWRHRRATPSTPPAERHTSASPPPPAERAHEA